ncbi:hypothetical protein PAQ31011_00643 [Pandoraea aquatica]|uniref:Uncharacterized protein n=1 Tax=Pandoraea aquatica TaxID=2508290 RepID=A0A5E4SA56_9BURK|nr:hypothetical protein PAQ31011_00643 [Pandoraea aquatica]
MRWDTNEHLMWSAEDRRRRAVWIRLCSLAGSALFLGISFYAISEAYGALEFHKPLSWGRFSPKTYRFEEGRTAYFYVAGLHALGGIISGGASIWYLLKGIFQRSWI